MAITSFMASVLPLLSRPAPQSSSPSVLQPTRAGQLPQLEEGRVEHLALVARAAVGQDGDDGMARPQLPRHPDGAGDVDAGRAAEAEPFFLQQVEYNGQPFGVGNLIGEVDRGA